jgi:signal transduction histidine kinase
MKALHLSLGGWDRWGPGPLLILMFAVILTTSTLVGDPWSRLTVTALVVSAVLLLVHRSLTGTTGWATLVRLDGYPLPARALVVVAVVALGVGAATGGAVAEAATLGGALVLTGTTAAVLRRVVVDERRQVRALRSRLEAVEVSQREDRARLHEINATVAGIASAQQLLGAGLTHDHTDALLTMMRSELDRLQRLVSDRAPSRRRSVDLDETIGQIVLAHLARGRLVVWEPTGLRALGRSDEIAEVVNVLLENAAVHGGPDAVSVTVTGEPQRQEVTITVADHGPGVPPELRESIFDWGVSRTGSPGQGIGLHVAADIARALGGRLELVPSATGAVFALHLAAAAEEVTADEHVARAG